MTSPKPRILVVDDDPVLRRLTTRQMEQAGYDVVSAGTGLEALALVETSKPDLLLLDFNLPDINGNIVCRRIKQAPHSDTPHVILFSGSRTDTEDQAFGLEEGADGYITRPIANRELLARVEAMLRLRQVEGQLREQERFAAVGQLTGGLAHSLNSMLQGILLNAQLALRDASLTPTTRRSLQHMEEEVHQAATLVQQMLDFSGQAILHRRSVPAAPLVRETASEIERQLPSNISLKIHIEVEDEHIWGDRQRLSRIVANLAENARQAMPTGGPITITLTHGPATQPCVVCGAVPGGDWLQLSVQDEGPGMSKDIARRAFEPFFTTQPARRRGLGLSQALGIVKQHNGHIALQSAEGRGATITVYLPPHRQSAGDQQ